MRAKPVLVSTQSEVETLKKEILNAILDKKGENVVSLDLRKIGDAVTYYFIVCDALTTIQVKAIAEHVYDQVKERTGQRPWHKEGFENLEWVLLDYVDIVVHIFRSETREFYKLEELWEDAAREVHE